MRVLGRHHGHGRKRFERTKSEKKWRDRQEDRFESDNDVSASNNGDSGMAAVL